MEALPEVVKAVGDRCEVYVDGGFSHGGHIFKALALGAKMVSGSLVIVMRIVYESITKSVAYKLRLT